MHLRALHEISDEDIDLVVHAVSTEDMNNVHKCCICNQDGHSTIDCHKFIAYNLCLLKAKDNPVLVSKLNAKYKHFPQMTKRPSPPTKTPNAHKSAIHNITTECNDDPVLHAPSESAIHCISLMDEDDTDCVFHVQMDDAIDVLQPLLFDLPQDQCN
jgi:hypothetical protein